jgi:hypothetical protein
VASYERLSGLDEAFLAFETSSAYMHADWTGGALLSWAARLLNNARIYNLIVTNVPGPPIPLYLMGARMRAAYPHLPLFEHQGLGIALLSYLDGLYVGLTADWSLGPLAEELAADLEAAVDGLATAAGLETAPPKRPQRRELRVHRGGQRSRLE